MDPKAIMKIFEDTAYIHTGGTAEELKAAKYIQSVAAGFGLLELIFRATGNDLLLVVDIAGDEFLQAQQLRLAADDGDLPAVSGADVCNIVIGIRADGISGKETLLHDNSSPCLF